MGLQISKAFFLPRGEINPKLPVIPDDVIEEILSRLPGRSLLRFRCVSKSWCSLIDNKLFITNHLQNMAKNHRRMIYNCRKHGLKQPSLPSYMNDGTSIFLSSFDDRKNSHLTTAGATVVGHCNGVLCILKQPGSFFFWNPTTRISFALPKLELVTRKCGFGWDEETDTYKVFAVVSNQGQKIGKVYSTKRYDWKTIDHGCLALCRATGKVASGKIHWLKKGGLEIESFDLNSEVFGMMDNPYEPEAGDFMRLGDDTDGCLRVICKNYSNKTCKFWSMKKYGVEESWVEKVLPYEKSACCKPVSYYHESLVSPYSQKKYSLRPRKRAKLTHCP